MIKPVVLSFDAQAYSIEAIQKAAYRCVKQIAVELTSGDGKYMCLVTPNVGVEEDAFTHAVEEFRKNALDYQLRQQIRLETQPLRNLILGIAFSRTGLQRSG